MCRTRWVQRIDAVDIFQSLHQSIIVACMEVISTAGRGLDPMPVLAITTTEFLCALVTHASSIFRSNLRRTL